MNQLLLAAVDLVVRWVATESLSLVFSRSREKMPAWFTINCIVPVFPVSERLFVVD